MSQIAKRPWYLVLLARMEQKAQAECSLQNLCELGEDMKASVVTEAERGAIVAELDRILAGRAPEHSPAGLVPKAVQYLELFRHQIAGAAQ